ncbi:MAG: aldose epimerase [Gorillibacterium sp.]|nr:aldose epimerase [Gorillibacterium sp.]
MSAEIEKQYAVIKRLDVYTIYELKESSTNSRVTVCPERGGIVMGFEVAGRQLLYLDRETFVDPKANIRGGIPILFPISGQLPGGQYHWEGMTYSMKNHGVARDRAWEVVRSDDQGQASLTLKLTSSDETFISFPFSFELIFTYRLKNGKLSIEQEYINKSKRAMPMYAGFHPYFSVVPGAVVYRSDATRMLDYNINEEKPFTDTLDLSHSQDAVVLLDAKQREISFQVEQGLRIRLSYSDVFSYVVLWTASGKPFICIEPWMAKNGEMLRGEELVKVEPGESLQAELKIEVE